ncbi:hypothetical protein [Halothiobacillus sp.]|uniref:hypothetical protein n=1 Tax=Halothiobacillus sp. TaxID=1891311 RepID=UPI002AD4771F|nr:hypothetical protein [Halothiobacillus sp.]
MQTRPISLVHRYAHPERFTRSLIVAIVLSFAFLAISALIFYLQTHPATTTDTDGWDKFQYLAALIGGLLLGLLLVPAVLTLRRQTVRIDDLGIQFDNGGGWLGFIFGRSWSLRWGEIEHAAWQFTPQQLRATRLALRAEKDTRLLVPWVWLDPNQPASQTPHSIWRPTRAKFLPILEHMPIAEAISARRPDLGLATANAEGKITKGFDLNGVTPVTGLIAATMAFGVLYFIVENYFALSAFYVNGPPWVVLIGAAIASGAIILAILRRTEPKRSDSPIYALLFAIAIGFIAYPLSIRINMWTAPQPAISSPYQLGGDYLWHPTHNPKLPVLDIYLKSSQWWRQFGPGDTHHFTVQHGGLGDWLIDMKALHQEQQNFYHCDGVLDCTGGSH